MRNEAVALQFAQDAQARPVVVFLREPCGRDELAVDRIDTSGAIALLDSLLQNTSAANGFSASHLTASDRDALFAALYRICWSDFVSATVNCAACAERFDLDFSLSHLQKHLRQSRVELDAKWTLPTGLDELLSVSALNQEAALIELAQRCGATNSVEIAELNVALENAAPILDVDLEVNCPECENPQKAHFDVQSFLLQRILGERELLLSEIHALAKSYGWSLAEILSLSRSTRQNLVKIIVDGGAQ